MTDLWKMSATEIADAVRSKQLSAAEVTHAHLERIGSVNSLINAVVQESPDEALASAKAVDEAISQGKYLGVLCGVPVTINVNVDQMGQATTNGLGLQRNLIAQSDSPVVSNIRAAGGIIVGRTNTPTFSLRWFTKNDLHGQTLNPQDLSITPGSSLVVLLLLLLVGCVHWGMALILLDQFVIPPLLVDCMVCALPWGGSPLIMPLVKIDILGRS